MWTAVMQNHEGLVWQMWSEIGCLQTQSAQAESMLQILTYFDSWLSPCISIANTF